MGDNDYFDYQEREAEQARTCARIDARRRGTPISDEFKILAFDELRRVMLARITEDGDYQPRDHHDTSCDLLREILHLVTDGQMGDQWRGPEKG